MSDTPQTDQEEIVMGRTECDRYVLAEFARRLERERDEALIDRANGDIATMTINHYERILRERNEARELAQQMSESNQVLQAEVRDYRKTTDKTPPSNNEMHLNLVLQEVAKLAKTLKEERDEARQELNDIRLILGADADGYTLLHAVCAVQNERDEARDQLKEKAK
jgi:hypothetical protein